MDKRKNVKGTIVTILIIIFLSILSLAQIFPFYLQLVTSLQPTEGFVPIDGHIYLPEGRCDECHDDFITLENAISAILYVLTQAVTMRNI